MGRAKKQGRFMWVPRSGSDQRKTILSFSANDAPPDVISKSLHLDVAHMEQVLGATGASQDEQAASSQAHDDVVVSSERLMAKSSDQRQAIPKGARRVSFDIASACEVDVVQQALGSTGSPQELLKGLWLSIQAIRTDDRAMQAAACLLSAHLKLLEVDLSDLSSDLLMEAIRFLDEQDAAIAFAKGFFDYDLGVSACEPWPQKSTASIFLELAHRLADDKSEERLIMLLKGYGIDESHAGIQDSLTKQLQHEILSQETNDAFEQEGLFLKLALKEGQDLPVDVVSKLALEQRHLGQASADQLMILSEQLGRLDRCVDASQVAVVAAKAFKSMDQLRRSEEAFLKAFNWNQLNRDAAEGVAGAVASAHGRCKELEGRCQQWKESSQLLEDAVEESGMELQELKQRCQQLEVSREQLEKDGQRTEQDRKALEKRCKELEKSTRTELQQIKEDCQRLEKSRKELEESYVKLERRPPLLMRSLGSALLSVVWDLSSYDFTDFKKGQEQKSEKFQLPGGINAWMKLCPKGRADSAEGKAGLFLHVNKPAVVKWTVQSGSSEAKTVERDFSEAPVNPDGMPDGRGYASFMPTSETNGRITLRILSVQLQGSTELLLSGSCGPLAPEG